MEDYFVLTPDDAGHVDFVLGAAWSTRMREVFLESAADGLVVNYTAGFIGADIKFVRDLPLRRMNVLDRGIIDLTPGHDLAATLEEF